MWPLPIDRRRRLLVYLALYTLLFAAAFILGYRMEVPYNYFQFLAPLYLKEQLWRSLFYLHAQPPLPNLLLGLALKLEGWVGIAPAQSLLALQFLMGATIVGCLHYLAHALIRHRVARHLFLLLFLANPLFYSFLFLYFYTVHELFFLSLFFVAAYVYLQNGSGRAFALAAAAVLGLIYTRSLFHFTWGVLVLLFLLFLDQRQRGKLVPRHLVVLLVTAGLMLLWPLKNRLQFGFFGYSSWQGYNLAQGLLPRSPEMLFDLPPDQHLPPAYDDIPVLARPQKAGGSPNWNYYPLIENSRQLGAQALALIRARPALLWEKAGLNYRHGYTLYGGRNPYEGILDKRSTGTSATYWWHRLYEIVFFQYLGNDTRTDPGTGFFFLFPLLLALSFWQLWRRWSASGSASGPESGTIALILFTILFVTVLILLTDGIEGNRLRFSTEPYLFLLAAWLLPARIRRQGR